MIWQPGFTSTLVAWVLAALTIVLGHHYVPATAQGLIAVAAGLVTHGHIIAKAKPPLTHPPGKAKTMADSVVGRVETSKVFDG